MSGAGESGFDVGVLTALVDGLAEPTLIVECRGAVVFANRPALDTQGLVAVESGALRLGTGALARRLVEVGLPGAVRDGSWHDFIAVPAVNGDRAIEADMRVWRLGTVPSGYYAMIVTPLSETTQAEERSRLLAAVIDQSTEFIAWHGRFASEARINPAAASLVGGGISADDPLPARIRDLFVPDSRLLIDEVGAPEMYRTGSWRGAIQIRNVDTGEVRDLDWSQFLVYEKDRVLGSAAMGKDVTDQKEGERALRAARAEADRANRAKSEFLSRMSHELRTPLTAIAGFSQLLRAEDLTTDQLDNAAHISRAARHLLELINELLDVSQIESGRLSLSLEPVRLDDVINEALAMIAPVAATRGVVVVDLRPQGKDQHVRVDRQRFRQVLINLLANAVKYNHEGGDVQIAAAPVSTERLRLTITDTGLGIADDDLGRLFQPFDRFGAMQTEVEGTGLGLALTKGLVEAMGGTIGATSALGRGSSFWIELELLDTPTGTPSEQTTTETPQIISGASRTLLYIDDNPANLKLVERILAFRPEVALLTAVHGRVGLDIALREQPELVLLDLNLPDISGEEVLLRLRADPRTAEIPVVIVSGDATQTNIAALLGSGATDYLTKPFDINHLLALIDKVSSAEP